MTALTRKQSRLRRLVAGIAGLGLIATGLTVVGLTTRPAVAADSLSASAMLQGFDPANIIDDAVMFNGSTMTVAQIQSFMNSKQPTCAPGATCLKSLRADIPAMTPNPMCAAMSAVQNASSAQIIAAVARACSVNPQVIMVMLQKEQTLITGRTPYSGETVSLIYRKATGLGCPDTAACDPSKYGIFNQLYGVAYWLVRYTSPPGTTGSGWTKYNWFPVGSLNGVLYHPNAACGARAITIQNKATASLYYYTPYQPNDASIAAGWGIGNSCSSYGNRNFYLYFTSWFGSTHYVVTGAVATFWRASGGAKGVYGNPVSNVAASSSSGGGTVQIFAHGAVYISPAGTVGVNGAMYSEYARTGGPGGALGWPSAPASVRKGAHAGTTQRFQHGIGYVSSAGSAAVTGSIAAKYATLGSETGALGYPLSDPAASTAKGGATWQGFQHGRIVTAAGTTSTLTGDVLTKWLQRGAEGSSLGWPIADAKSVTANGSTGITQAFQTGSVFVRAGVRTVTGTFWSNYRSHRGPAGTLGWPVSVAQQSTQNGGGWSQRFTGGAIFTNPSAGTHAIKNGPILALFDQRGGTNGTLGWLVSEQRIRAGVGGSVGTFTSGAIYTSKVGTVAVRGDILARFLARGGPAGTLGWPTSNAKTVKGVTVQTFQHGVIRWTAAGGARASSR